MENFQDIGSAVPEISEHVVAPAPDERHIKSVEHLIEHTLDRVPHTTIVELIVEKRKD